MLRSAPHSTPAPGPRAGRSRLSRGVATVRGTTSRPPRRLLRAAPEEPASARLAQTEPSSIPPEGESGGGGEAQEVPAFPSLSDPTSGGVEGLFAAQAQERADVQASEFLSELADARASRESTDDEPKAAGPGADAASSSPIPASQRPSPALAAKIAASRAAKEATEARAAEASVPAAAPPTGAGEPSISGAATGAFPSPAEVAEQVERELREKRIAERAEAARAEAARAERSDGAELRPLGDGQGSATEAANFLGGREASLELTKGLDKDMTAEQFTKAKEAKRYEAGPAKVISVDADRATAINNFKRASASTSAAPESTTESASGQDDEEEEEYELGTHKPTIATWGMFERPSNISEAYGGGRNVSAEQLSAELKATEADRKARTRAALAKWRKDQGLEVDPDEEAEAEAKMQAGMALFKAGQLREAQPLFQVAADIMPARTRVGGEARLQVALCIDSLGDNDAALPIYKMLANHPQPHVSKRAKQMVFGFESMEFLKTRTISYTPDRSAYERYFRQLTGQWDNMYYLDNEPDEDLTWVSIFATSVMLLPFGVVAAAVVTK